MWHKPPPPSLIFALITEWVGGVCDNLKCCSLWEVVHAKNNLEICRPILDVCVGRGGGKKLNGG